LAKQRLAKGIVPRPYIVGRASGNGRIIQINLRIALEGGPWRFRQRTLKRETHCGQSRKPSSHHIKAGADKAAADLNRG
jgi:hypothetical protein